MLAEYKRKLFERERDNSIKLKKQQAKEKAEMQLKIKLDAETIQEKNKENILNKIKKTEHRQKLLAES